MFFINKKCFINREFNISYIEVALFIYIVIYLDLKNN